jgi:peptidoglycan/LPS O-acetylase OafA/YrhL
VILAIALAVWGWIIWLTATHPPWERLYCAMDTRAASLLVGCALGVVLKLAPAGAYPKVERILPKLAWPFIIGFFALLFFFAFNVDFYFYVGFMVLAVLPGAVLVTLLVRTSRTPLHRFLERPEIVFLGKIFYGLYLWHFPVLGLMRDFGAPKVVLVFVGFPLTVLVATLSYAYIERYFMRVRSAPPQPVAPVPTYAPASS